MGDFNFPGVNWETYDCDICSQIFRDLILDNYLTQHVHESTREGNILDLVLSTNSEMVEDLEVQDHLGTSDHHVLVWSLVYDIQHKINKCVRRQYYKGNYRLMREWLDMIDWEKEMYGLSLEEMWRYLCDMINMAMDKFVPVNES